MTDKLPCITLNRHADPRLKQKHPWIFSNEVHDPKLLARQVPGGLVDVLNCHGEYVGTGFVNAKSLIAIRLLTRDREESIDQEFFEKKIETAIRLREVMYGANSPSRSTYRAVFGEPDGLPGLIIDRFQDAWVMEPHSLGMALRKDILVAALLEVSKRQKAPTNIIFRTDNRAAALEGMTQESSVVSGEIPSTGIFAVEGNITFPVDPINGQKTGFFFDHRDNRSYFAGWVENSVRAGREVYVLDTFCHAGAWGLRALQAGAKRATFIDASSGALESVKKAAAKMGVLDKIECIEGDALTILAKMKDGQFNAIALDPPALVPNKKALSQGAKNYRDLNREALRVLRGGGVLSTSSCSFHMDEIKFEETVHKALLDSSKSARVIYRGGLSADHPVLLGMGEGRYLKNLVLAIP